MAEAAKLQEEKQAEAEFEMCLQRQVQSPKCHPVPAENGGLEEKLQSKENCKWVHAVQKPCRFPDAIKHFTSKANPISIESLLICIACLLSWHLESEVISP